MRDLKGSSCLVNLWEGAINLNCFQSILLSFLELLECLVSCSTIAVEPGLRI